MTTRSTAEVAKWLRRAWLRTRLEFRHNALRSLLTRAHVTRPHSGETGVEMIPAFDKKLPTGVATYTPAKRFRSRRRDRRQQPPHER